jgi:acetoin utilization deacetylase AcuC-like enzyme
MSTLLLTDDLFLAHDPGEGHPETPDRLRSILHELESLPEGARWGTARDATKPQVARAHTLAHVEALERLAGRHAELDPDTMMSPGSYAAALRAAGAGVTLVDALLKREAASGFALVRPPGHHAERDRAMGFCLFNNVGIAAEHARASGVERVAIVDWDVHHGNGTQHLFEDRADVLFLSTHRFPFYPGTGAATEKGVGPGAGFTVNVPLPAAMGDGDYGAFFRDLVSPVLAAYRPGLVLVSAGFDPYVGDPLGGMRVSEEGFAAMALTLKQVAAESGAPLGLLLEGGYDLGGLGRSVRRCVEVLAGGTAQTRTDASPRGADAIAQVRAAQIGHWRL